MGTALLSGGFLIAGILLGAFVTHTLSKSARHEEWLRDARRQEYKEVLTALSTAYLELIRFGTPGTVIPGEIERRISDLEAETYRVLQDRILIANELESKDIPRLWTEAVENFARSRTEGYERRFAERYKRIRETLVELATKSV